MHILFLSADTGGGHRASAEALAKQVRTVLLVCYVSLHFRPVPSRSR
jgi:hypothetical protein